jgi:glycine betaine/choline ABC-type transport system substrate-binding protein
MSRQFLRMLLSMLAVLAVATGVAACGDDDEGGGGDSAATTAAGADGAPSAEEKAENKISPVDGASGTSLTVGSKNFTEQYVLGEIYAQALKAAGYKIKTDLKLGSEVIAHQALKQGEIDGYPEYTGTALTSFFKVEVPDVPKDPKQAFEDAKAGYAKEDITALAPTPFENTYRLGMLKDKAKELGVTKNSDLKGKASDLRISGYPECRQRIDCLLGVQRTYGIKFGKFVSSNTPYTVLDSGDADIAFLFTTDGKLASGKYAVLDDDKSFFPPYNISFTIRNDALKKIGNEGQQVIESVQKYMTEEVMQELNARVDVDKEEPSAAARSYLKYYGFTS